MSVQIWNILFIISLILFVAGIVAITFTKIIKNTYYHEFNEDEVIKKETTVNSYNTICFTTGETKKYIKKYVICKTFYDRYLVCNYTKNFGYISYFVKQFDKNKKVISVLKVVEKNTSDSSKILALNTKCAYVNVIISKVEDIEINANVIKPLSIRRINLYSFISSCNLFLGLFIVRHILIILIAGDKYMKHYMNDLLNYIAIIASLVFAISHFLISSKALRKRNVKALNGGAFEYEFI